MEEIPMVQRCIALLFAVMLFSLPVVSQAEESKPSTPAAPAVSAPAAPAATPAAAAPVAAAPATAAPAADAAAAATPPDVKPVLNTGDTAWMLVSSALVLLMIPGLALFYGGMVRQKNVLSTMMHSFVAMGIVGVQWAVIGYSLSFGPDMAKMGLIGDFSKFMLNGLIIMKDAASGTVEWALFRTILKNLAQFLNWSLPCTRPCSP
jgi:Amt family ammonium transporter